MSCCPSFAYMHITSKRLFTAHELPKLNWTSVANTCTAMAVFTAHELSTNRPSFAAANRRDADTRDQWTRRVTGSACCRSVQFTSVQFMCREQAFTLHDAGDVIRLYCLTLLINIHQRLCLMPLLGKFFGWSRVILWIIYCNTARSVDGDFLPW